MGRLVGALAPVEQGGRIDPAAHRRRRPTASWSAPADVGDRFFDAEALVANARARGAAAACVIGTTGWSRTRPTLRKRRRRGHRRRRLAELLDRRRTCSRCWSADAARLMRRSTRIRRVDSRGASRGQAGRAVGHGAAPEAGDGQAGYVAADRRLLDAGRIHSRHPHDRIRRPVGYDQVDAHGARSHGFAPRRAAAANGFTASTGGLRWRTCWGGWLKGQG